MVVGTAAAEFVRSRYFSVADWQTHTGVHVYRPRFRYAIEKVLVPEGGAIPQITGNSASVVGRNYMPQAPARFLVHGALRMVGAASHVAYAAYSADRLIFGDSKNEATGRVDAFFLGQSLFGLLAVLHPDRLERGVAAHTSAALFAIGMMADGERMVNAWQYRDRDPVSFHRYSGQAALMTLTYAAGMGGRLLSYQDQLTGRVRRGSYSQLRDDFDTRRLLSRQQDTEYEWNLSGGVHLTSKLVTRYETPEILSTRMPPERSVLVLDHTYEGFHTLYDWRSGLERRRSVGTFEVHQPVRLDPTTGKYVPIGMPDVTTRIVDDLQNQNFAPRLRDAVQALPNSPIREGWFAHGAAAPQLIGAGDGYRRQVLGSFHPPLRQASLVRAWQWEPDHLTGEAVRLTRPMVAVRPDYRGDVGWTTWLTHPIRYWKGTIPNLRETLEYRRQLRAKVRNDGFYLGYADHPQVTRWAALTSRGRNRLREEQGGANARYAAMGITPGSPNVPWLSRIPADMRGRPYDSPGNYLKELRGRDIAAASQQLGAGYIRQRFGGDSLTVRQYLKLYREAERFKLPLKDYLTFVKDYEARNPGKNPSTELNRLRAEAKRQRIPPNDFKHFLGVVREADSFSEPFGTFLQGYRQANVARHAAQGEAGIMTVADYARHRRGGH
ncbi:MAG: hypothetical protein Q7S98_00865 [Deltaproteobacteria bacterium]|nr:hypothetical protein [Deltaproteobacteria bacterium]